MKEKILLGAVIVLAVATVLSAKHTLLYGTMLFTATLFLGSEVEKDEK